MTDTVRLSSDLTGLLSDSAPAHSTNRQLIRDIVVTAIPQGTYMLRAVCACDSVTPDAANFGNLVNTTMQPAGGVVVVTGVPRIESNLTIPANVRLKFMDGAYLAPDLGFTVTVNSSTKKWPIARVFGGGGSIQFGSKAADCSRPEFFGSPGDGVTNEITSGAWQKAHDALPATTGGTIKATARTYMVNGAGSTMAAPKILCNVTKPNVFVELGTARILFQGMSAAALAAQNDAGTGANVFSGFVFGSGVLGGGVSGGYVEGDSDGTAVTNLRSRAKFIANDGASQTRFTGIRGKLIVGNLVNVRGAGSGLAWSDDVSVTDCKAYYCAESGINFMGGVENSICSLCVSRFNKFHGIESGANDSLFSNNICSDNSKDGISQVGRDSTFANNDLKRNSQLGFNFQWSSSPGFDGSGNQLRGGIIKGNGQGGVACDGGTSHNEINGTRVVDNTGEGIKLNATCTNYTLRGVTVGDTGGGTQLTGIHAVTASKLTITGGTKTFGHSTAGLLIELNSDTVTVTFNEFLDTVTIAASTTNPTVRGNKGYVTKTFGTATIPSGSTTVAIPHGLPAGSVALLGGGVKNIRLQLTNNPTAVTRLWPTGVTSTQFIANVNADPGATAATIGWCFDLES